MKFSEETLMAYADNELDAKTRAAVEEAMATDPEVARKIAQHKALRGKVRLAFNNVVHEPTPQRLIDAARGVPAVRREGNVIPLRRKAPASRAWPQWAAIAASLVARRHHRTGNVTWLGRRPRHVARWTTASQRRVSSRPVRATRQHPDRPEPGKDRSQLQVEGRQLLPHVHDARIDHARGPGLPRPRRLARADPRTNSINTRKQRRLSPSRPQKCRNQSSKP